MKVILLLLLLIGSSTAFSTNYYVSQSIGSDTNSGLIGFPWKTLSEVENNTFNDGDIIYLKSGDVWAEQFNFVSSGSAGNPIVITKYGSGNNPEIRAWGEVANWNTNAWQLFRTGIYRMAIGGDFGTRLWLNGKEHKQSQTLSLTTDYPWKWTGDSLYVKSPSPPNTYFNSIASSKARQRGIEMIGVSYVTFSGIEVTGGNDCFHFIGCHNIIVEDCKIGIKNAGFAIRSWSNQNDSTTYLIVRNNLLYTGDSLSYNYARDNHVTGDAIYIGQGSTNAKVYNNYFDNWSHQGVAMINLDATYPYHDNEVYQNYITAPLIDYGRGLGADISANSYNCSFYDNIVTNTTVQCQFNGTNLKVYNNIIDDVAGCPYPVYSTEGMGISMELYAENVHNCEIYNNVIMRCGHVGIRLYHEGGSLFTIENNNFHNNNIWENGTQYNYGIQIFTSEKIKNNIFTDNHIYKTGSSNTISYLGSAYTVANWNMADTNGDVISGNDATYDYTIPIISGFPTIIQNQHFYYNYNQATDKEITITSPQIDENGVKFQTGDIISLSTFTSKILFTDENPISNRVRILPNGKVPINSRKGYRVMVKK